MSRIQLFFFFGSFFSFLAVSYQTVAEIERKKIVLLLSDVYFDLVDGLFNVCVTQSQLNYFLFLILYYFLIEVSR